MNWQLSHLAGQLPSVGETELKVLLSPHISRAHVRPDVSLILLVDLDLDPHSRRRSSRLEAVDSISGSALSISAQHY